MATIKSYTDISQSKKLAEFLPLETADMMYWDGEYITHPYTEGTHKDEQIPVWSLTALLDYLSANFYVDIKYLYNYWELDCHVQVAYDKELVNACYKMIIKLHEQKLL